MRRSGLDMKKRIIQILKENRELPLGEIERKANTNNLTILSHLKELEYFGLIELTKHKKSEKTGRPYTSVKLKN